MSGVRRIRLGDTRYRLKPLTREQKLLLNKAHYVANEWLFVSESDSYLRVVKKPYICIYLCLLMMTDFAIRYQFPCSKLTQV